MEPIPPPDDTVIGHEPGELEHDLADLVVRSRRTLAVIILTQGALLLIAITAIILLGVALLSAEGRIGTDEGRIVGVQSQTRAALCDSQFTIATVTIEAPASKTLIAFVEASRKAFVVLDCPGSIGRPSPALVKDGAKFGIAIRY